MAYQAEISRDHPGCILFLIDQSASMEDPFGGEGSNRRKADGVADAINRLLLNLIMKCTMGRDVRDYWHVGVIGYGGRVYPAFEGSLQGRSLVPISEVANSPVRIDERKKRVDDGTGGLTEVTVQFQVWFDPVADGGTPMCEALAEARAIIQDWVTQHSDSFPPIVINITDGEATDGDPRNEADLIRAISTSDGNVLLLNVYLSSSRAIPIEYPDSADQLPDEYGQLLFEMSSVLPNHIQEAARKEGYRVSELSRGCVFNADIVSLYRFLEIGTRLSLPPSSSLR